jgi:Fur family ferric uptake transcriptional regulator
MDDNPILQVLDGAGYRLTQPRRQVADLVSGRTASFTAADLMADAQRRGVRIGRATVFRALDTLAELGALERLELADGEHAYVTCEPRSRHHHHVVCRRCGRASEIVGCDLEPWARQVQRATGYEVDTHRIELYGMCPDCRRAA